MQSTKRNETERNKTMQRHIVKQPYRIQWHLTLNDYHTFLLWNYSQVGSFPLWSLQEGVFSSAFLFDASSDILASMIVGCSEAKSMATKQKVCQIITVITMELAYLPSRLRTVDATTMRVSVQYMCWARTYCSTKLFMFLCYISHWSSSSRLQQQKMAKLCRHLRKV